jgi:hypothetical protein
MLNMAYLETDQDAQNYQGWSLTRVYVEELTQYADSKSIFKLFATLRSPVPGIRCQFRATCNPGGPGHHWVKSWAIDIGPLTPTTDPSTGLTRVFIPAKLSDNPALTTNDPQYVNRLRASGSPELVRAWLEGDWNVIEGAFFPEFATARHVLAPFRVPDHWVRFRSMDWGSAKPFSVGWWAHVPDDTTHSSNPGRVLPRVQTKASSSQLRSSLEGLWLATAPRTLPTASSTRQHSQSYQDQASARHLADMERILDARTMLALAETSAWVDGINYALASGATKTDTR